MSHTCFRVNPHSIVAWMSRNSLLKAGAKSEGEVTADVWPNGWVFVWELSGSGFESSCSHFIHHGNINVNLMIENVNQIKSGIMINFDVIVNIRKKCMWERLHLDCCYMWWNYRCGTVRDLN